MGTTAAARAGRLIGTVVAVVAVALVLGADVSADKIERSPDHPSKASFKKGCIAMEGAWNENAGSTSCMYPDGAGEVCDENAKNCTYYPPPKDAPAPGPFDDLIQDAEPLPILSGEPVPFDEKPVVEEPIVEKSVEAEEPVTEPADERA